MTIDVVKRAALFVATGLLTYLIQSWIADHVGDKWQLFAQLLTGMPFGVALLSRARKQPITVLLDGVAWVAAYRLAVAVAGVNSFLGTAVGGAVGALCVTAATGLGCRSLYSLRALTGAAFLGAVFGLPFGLIATLPDQQTTWIIAGSFPLWQVAVGQWIDRRAEAAALKSQL